VALLILLRYFLSTAADFAEMAYLTKIGKSQFDFVFGTAKAG